MNDLDLLLRRRRRRWPVVVGSALLVAGIVAGSVAGLIAVQQLQGQVAGLEAELATSRLQEAAAESGEAAGPGTLAPVLDPEQVVVEETDGVTSFTDLSTGVRTVVQPVDRSKLTIVGSSTMREMAADFGRFADRHDAALMDATGGGLLAEHMLAELGSRPLVTDAVDIPASGSTTLTSPNVPAGIQGVFTMSGHFEGYGSASGTISKTEGPATAWTFERDGDGLAVRIPAGTEFVPDLGAEGRDGIAVLNIGKNNLAATDGVGSSDVDELVSWTEDAYRYLSATGKYVLVVGHFQNSATAADSPGRARIQQYNDALRDRFGPRFFDLEAVVTSDDIWKATGITPTAADRAEQAAGNKPDGLSRRVDGAVDPYHLDPAAATTISGLMQSRMVELGWY
jgi:hypothetical protein